MASPRQAHLLLQPPTSFPRSPMASPRQAHLLLQPPTLSPRSPMVSPKPAHPPPLRPTLCLRFPTPSLRPPLLLAIAPSRAPARPLLSLLSSLALLHLQPSVLALSLLVLPVSSPCCKHVLRLLPLSIAGHFMCVRFSA